MTVMKIINQMDTRLAHELFDFYNGELVWPLRLNNDRLNRNTIKPLTPIGWICNGRRMVKAQGVTYYYHVLLWNYFVGKVPEGLTIDHMDRNPLNNNLSNLRVATDKEQSRNTGVRKNNKCGYKYINKCSGTKDSYIVRFVNDDGNRIYVGCFKGLERAVTERDKALKEHGIWLELV